MNSSSRAHPAMLWERWSESTGDAGTTVRCGLCAHRCVIKDGAAGICRVRVNTGGELRTRVYGRAVSLAVDPVEKKPLFHFFPGARTLSLATVGCNFLCLHCQNAGISQWPRCHDLADDVPGEDVSPEDVVGAAIARRCEIIAYTYTEPTIYLEYVLDVARLARPRGVKNVLVTNGYMTREAVAELRGLVDAANVDLKGMDDAMLRREVHASSGPVLETIEALHRAGVWVEVTTLVIPGSNDDDTQLGQIAAFIAGVSRTIPWHVSRFRPEHKLLDRPPTSDAILQRAARIGRDAGLEFVYMGNAWGEGGESTQCPECGSTVIARHGFSLGAINMKAGSCGKCGYEIAGCGLP